MRRALVELKMEIRSEAQVREPGAKLPPDEAFGVIQTVDGSLARVVLADHAHLDGSVAKVGTELDLADRGHSDPWILQVADDDLADFFA